ncbi:molybdopterin-dependent oxidoreductase [Sphingomonas jaspsi]|uniref:molybdopterin-dependent oxidoreductase n=1 Tax=Sphingomonas jaspsi TaxID=392409 RepID=UPI0004B6BDBC|nr:molybdopterin-dependent oxidoreductase [Sphingomonas jaspsi]
MDDTILPRRQFLAGLTAGAGGLILTGCDKFNANPDFREALRFGDQLHYRSQRLITGRNELAREYRPDQMSPVFRANGNINPGGDEYQAHVANRFADWRLVVDGLVARPLRLSLAQLQSMPTREQTTRHDCVEGWSAIGKWAGPQLSRLLDAARLSPRARFIVFHCADRMGANPYYESIDLVDAFHPQTILAWRMNGQMLPVQHGAPIRLRVERQLGYKQAKYVMRIEARERLDDLYGGKGGAWEDRADYHWYAGI